MQLNEKEKTENMHKILLKILEKTKMQLSWSNGGSVDPPKSTNILWKQLL